MTKTPIQFSAAALLLLTSATTGSGLGFRLVDMDAHASARGNAFAATADTPAAVYYNPAGITQVSAVSMQAGVYAIDFDADYRSSQTGESFTNEAGFKAVPNAYITVPIETTPLTFGIGAYAPFGLVNDWPDDTDFRTVATRSRLEYRQITPVLAWEINPTLSIGGGLTINDAQLDLRQGIFESGHPLANGDEFRFDGRDQFFGYTLGVRWSPAERHAFGLAYRSSTRSSLQGIATTRVPAAGIDAEERAALNLPFPKSAVIGYSFRPREHWNLEANLEWTDWSVLDTVTMRRDQSGDEELVFQWEESIVYKAGVTRYFENDFHISVGYMFSENTVPDDHYTPAVPEDDRHLGMAGVGWSNGDVSWNLGYQFGYSSTRRVRGSDGGDEGPADGDYQAIVNAFTGSVGISF